MAFTFDGPSKRIILDKTSTTASEIWSRYADWLALSDNSKWPLAMTQIGGDDLGDGLAIPPYIFLKNDWKVRPMESSHTLTITGNLFVEGGGDPIVSTLGNYNVLVKSVVPVQAQAFTPNGSASTLVPPLYTQGVDYSRPVGIVVADVSNSQLSFKTTLSESSADFWKDALILFVTGTLKHQTKKVSAFNPSTDFLSVSVPFTGVPAESDQFVLITF